MHSYRLVCHVTGLFHRAIIQSASALNHWAYDDPSVARRKAFRFGEYLGCHTSDSKELLDFLMKVPEKQLVDAMVLSVTEEVSTACEGRANLCVSIVQVKKFIKLSTLCYSEELWSRMIRSLIKFPENNM
jgi:carboxylesterase type B